MSSSRNTNSSSLSSSQPSLTRMVSLGAMPTTRSTASMPPPPAYPSNHEDLLAPIFDLDEHIQSEHLIREEFMALESIYDNHNHVTVEGTQKYNTSKNRYTNILPCDLTRVKLEKINGQEGSDYINANFIDGWPDHNAPNDTEPLRYLLHEINATQKSLPVGFTDSPIVVHCSAGVGRTGTFCTVHIMMSRLENSLAEEPIDFNLYGIVNNLRKQRPGMVQQLEQYIFCYETIADELKERSMKLQEN
eukprot:gene11565-13498_t